MANTELDRPATPSLPLAPKDYGPQFIDQLNNVHRLYYNRLNELFNGLLIGVGGRYVGFPSGAFSDLTDQTIGSTTSAYAFRLGTTDYTNGVSITNRTASLTATISNGSGSAGTVLNVTAVTGTIELGMELTSTVAGITAGTRVIAYGTGTGGAGTYTVNASQLVSSRAMTGALPSKITFAEYGVYNIQFSAQFTNTDTQLKDIDIWFRKNGTDITNSNSRFSVPNSHGGVDGHFIAALNFFVDLDPDDYIEIMWCSNSTLVSLQQIAAGTGPTRPATPSIIATASFVSRPI